MRQSLFHPAEPGEVHVFQLDLIMALLPSRTLSISLADNALAEPLSLEAPVQHMEVRDDVLAAFGDSCLGGNRAVSRDAKLKGSEKRMRDLVRREGDVRVLVEAL